MRVKKPFRLLKRKRSQIEVWVYRATDSKGELHEFSLGMDAKTTSRTAANAKALALWKAGKLLPDSKDEQALKNTVFGEYAADFFNDTGAYARRGGYKGKFSANYLAVHKAGLKALMPHFEKMRLKDITAPVMEKWIAKSRELVKPDGSPRWTEKTIRSYIITLKLILDEARRAGIIERSPFDERGAIRLPSKNPVKKRDAITLDEARRLFDPARAAEIWRSELARDACAVLLGTGLRLGELRALRGDALDLAAGFLDCKASWSRLEGAKGTKSGKNRKVPLPRSVAETLAKYQKIHGQGILFSITGEKPIPERYIRETFAHALEAVGINPAEQDERRLTPHCLRVSYNTFQILAGTLPDQLREVIGHSSSEMTSRYTSLKPEHLTSLAIVAGQAFEPAPEPTPSAPQGPNLEALAAQLADALARLEALSGKPPESK